MNWELIIVDGPDAGRRFKLPHDRPFVVGRGSASDTRINVPQISRVHCEIRIDGDHALLIDSGSHQGTIHRGNRITEPSYLAAGDLIEIGPIRLRVESDNPLDATTINATVSSESDLKIKDAPLNAIKASEDELIGKVIHGFGIEGLVAVGRTARIYRGVHLKDQTPVAFKVLHPFLAVSDEQRARFVRAMQTMLPIRHPHIIHVLNAGRKGSLCWSAMEWVQGLSVASLIDRIGTAGALDWEDVWRVAVHVARALEEAQRLNLIHRNITPTNILRRDQNKAYLLSDLCLAKALQETDADKLTRPGETLCDVAFVSPESVLNSKAVDNRSDQYSLGCTLYALLTGRPPHAGLTLAQILKEWKASEVAPIRFRRPGIYEPFEDIVLRMLRIRPEQRFAQPTELLKQLKEVGRRRGLDADWFPNI